MDIGLNEIMAEKKGEEMRASSVMDIIGRVAVSLRRGR
jgi:hypothetical protein